MYKGVSAKKKVTDPSPPPALQTTPSYADPPVQPSTSVSIPVGRRVNGVNPSLSLQRYHKVASLVHGGDNLYAALDSIGISRGSLRPQRLIAECHLLYPEANFPCMHLFPRSKRLSALSSNADRHIFNRPLEDDY